MPVPCPHSRPAAACPDCCAGAADAPTRAGVGVTTPPGDLARRPLSANVLVFPGADTTPPPGATRRPGAGSVPDGDGRGPDVVPAELPGYRLDRPLGRGGMGTVYLGRQLSLDRPVAVKVMSRRWAADPVFVARFTREAFAAALLNHPNVVQIYDIGEAAGVRFFSMEYVPGRTLADHVRHAGKLDCETAVGYVLQAARGLKHAHDRGLIHRDVKPDNLLLNDHGGVKVADLGLVKVPAEVQAGSADLPPRPRTPALSPEAGARGRDAPPAARGGDRADRLTASPGRRAEAANMTGHRMALGTPAYMAPEQCRDAAGVDHRADIYSLGCTLYVLVTGRPPFDGASAVEVMTKHACDPVVPPEAVVARVPPELSAVILRMMAKDPAHRFQSMADVVRTLERWLGVHHAGALAPREADVDELEAAAHEFNAAPAAVLRGRVAAGLVAACVLGAVLLAFCGRLGWAFGVASLPAQSACAYFAVAGARDRTHLFRRVRQFTLGLSLWDHALAAAGAVLFLALLWGLGLLGVWAGFALAGCVAAAGVRAGFDRAAARQRLAPLRACERLTRRLRLRGLDEDDVRLFVAKYAGRQWEELFEALFGFEAKLHARALLLRAAGAGARDRFAAWREPVLWLIDRWEKARRDAADRRLLEGVERARLVAGGANAAAATTQAADRAAALTAYAGAARGAAAAPDLGRMIAQPAPIIAPRPRGTDWHGAALGAVTGPHVRAALAGALLALCGLWAHQNGVFARAPASADALTGAATAPLVVAGLPAGWTAWVDSANVGWAGGLLLVSLFRRGHRMAALALLGAAVCASGAHLGIRTAEPVRPAHVALLLGSALALAGYRLGRR